MLSSLTPTQLRFVRGLAAAVASAVAGYMVTYLSESPVLGSTLTPVVTAALLSLDKYLRDRSHEAEG